MVKHKVIIALLFTFLASPAYTFAQQKKGAKNDAEQEQPARQQEEPAYSRREEKRKLKEERRRQKEEERRKEAEVREKYNRRYTKTTAPTNTGFKYPPTEIKSRYRVDVLVSLYLDELVKKKASKDN